MVKWIVGKEMDYYPWIEEFNNKKEAVECFEDNQDCEEGEALYLAKVVKTKKFAQ